MSCENHKKHLLGEADMKKVAQAIGDLHYDSLKQLLYQLQAKLMNDGAKDLIEGRVNLGHQLLKVADHMARAWVEMIRVWKISKPFMKETDDENSNLEYHDLQDQVKKHIADHDLWDWSASLSDDEMSCLVNLLLTFNPILPPRTVGNPTNEYKRLQSDLPKPAQTWIKANQLPQKDKALPDVVLVNIKSKVFAYNTKHNLTGLKNVITQNPEALYYCLSLSKEVSSNMEHSEPAAICNHCGDIIEHPLCRNCEIALTLPDEEY